MSSTARPSSIARRRQRRGPVPAALGAFLVLGSAACSPGESVPPPRTWPAGTVLALNGTPITADEVDAVGSIIARTEPQDVLTHLRRIALTNVVFPRVASIQVAGDRHAAARALASECKRQVDGGDELLGPRAGVLRQERSGNFADLGLEAWNYAVDAEIARWSQPLETVGAFEIVRVNARTQAGAPRHVHFEATVIVLPFTSDADPRRAIEALLDRSRLEFVDESWRDAVPEFWKHRLRGGSP